MPRRPDVDRPVALKLMLPETIRARLDLELFSDLEGRVPQGRYQEFFLARIQEYFAWKRLDLTLYGFPPGFFITGPKEMIEYFERKLKDESRNPSADRHIPAESAR